MCSLTYSGKLPFSVGFNVSNTRFTNHWILHTGVTDHMTQFPEFFSHIFHVLVIKKISIADGNMISSGLRRYTSKLDHTPEKCPTCF